jgi:hypothetical protein
MTDHEFIKTLLYCETPRPSPKPPFYWTFIGAAAYLRTRHGVFKLDLWESHVRDHVDGLQGTYTSATGVKDHLIFEFHELLSPDAKKLKNPDLVHERRIHAWRTGDGPRRSITWYVPPVGLAPLHNAIAAWVDVWGGA